MEELVTQLLESVTTILFIPGPKFKLNGFVSPLSHKYV